ncbi:calpain-1 catalytic subunit-like [Diretmus argenteus]
MKSTKIINLRYQDGSEGSPSNPAKFNNQDYEQLKQSYFSKGRLFVDNTFPPDSNSLGNMSDMSPWERDQVEWLRPADIMKMQNKHTDLSFFVEGASRFDFGQGSVGNCWFLAAIASLTLHKDLLVQVVPLDQNFNKSYAGIFHFRFWRFGKWVDVVIDDYLPTLYGELLSVRSKTGNEFWAQLLEKAYAKVCGSYDDMNEGNSSEAFKDFSGGVHMSYELRADHTVSHDAELWTSLSNATKCKSMLFSGTAQKGETVVNTVAHTGLVDAHAYSITGVTEVQYEIFQVKLVRLLNPWGKQEWNGRWSDKSDRWNKVSAEDRKKCFKRNNGEFWMELEDFCHYFTNMSICCENPNFVDGDVSCQWKCRIYDGSWVAGRTAGGNISEDTFSRNPQYRIKVKKIDREEVDDKNVLLSLMQKPDQRHRNKNKLNAIGLSIYQTPQGRLGSSFFNRTSQLKSMQTYKYGRELIELHSMQPGEYVIVPSTLKPNKTADFLLTVYSKADNDMVAEDSYDDMDGKPVAPKPTDKGKDTFANSFLFKSYSDQNEELDASQLRKLLNDNFPHGSTDGFDLDTCRSMIAIMDRSTFLERLKAHGQYFKEKPWFLKLQPACHEPADSLSTCLDSGFPVPEPWRGCPDVQRDPFKGTRLTVLQEPRSFQGEARSPRLPMLRRSAVQHYGGPASQRVFTPKRPSLHSVAPPLLHCAAAPPLSRATESLHHSIYAAQPHSVYAAQPHSLFSAQHYSLSAAQHCSPFAALRQRVFAVQSLKSLCCPGPQRPRFWPPAASSIC